MPCIVPVVLFLLLPYQFDSAPLHQPAIDDFSLMNYTYRQLNHYKIHTGSLSKSVFKLSTRDRKHRKQDADERPVIERRNMCRSVCTLCERIGSAGHSAVCHSGCVLAPTTSRAFEYCLGLWEHHNGRQST